MLARLRRRLRNFFRKTRTINNEPINKVSLVVIVLIDIFILINVFIGLNDAGNWPMSPSQAYPCYSSWLAYRSQATERKDIAMLQQALSFYRDTDLSLKEDYQQVEESHLGQVSERCLQYSDYQDQLDTPDNQAILSAINQIQSQVADLEATNQTIRNQYDSTLLEEIAGQPREQSINQVEAAQAKRELDSNTAQIATLQTDISGLETQLLEAPESIQFLAWLNDEAQFTAIQNRYNRANFRYPTQQIIFQGAFLLPLLAIAWGVHHYAQRRDYGLLALMSWHLLVIFWVPLIVKLFEFWQVGVLFAFFSGIIRVILGGLQFLVSYFYIFLIPLLGFGLIKFFQKIVFNPRLQAAGRVQKGRCVRCSKKLRSEDKHCPHCGYGQYVDCQACHQPTYRFLSHCRVCGAPQESKL